MRDNSCSFKTQWIEMIIHLEVLIIKSPTHYISFWLYMGNIIKITKNRNRYSDQTLQRKTKNLERH